MNAGCTALPALLNIKQVMQQRQVTGIWNGKDELPVSEKIRYHFIPQITYLEMIVNVNVIPRSRST